jgi:DNA repair protein RecO (recombination protein O)
VSGLYRDQGVVLRTIKLGEADRIVTFMTQLNGKVRAVAKGVRRTGSRFGARLEPTTHVALQCYRGRELDVVTQVETIDANRALREHYGCLTHAVSMLEAVDQVAQERERNVALYRMIVGALRTLAADPSPMVSAAFFWKLLALEGFQPMLDSCARCGGPTATLAGDHDGSGAGSDAAPDRGSEASTSRSVTAFDLNEGGVLCVDCGRHAGRRVGTAALEVVSRIMAGELRSVLAAPPRPEVLADVEHLGIAMLEHNSERRLRSAALL